MKKALLSSIGFLLFGAVLLASGPFAGSESLPGVGPAVAGRLSLAPTLGVYPDATVTAGLNATVVPDAAPTNATHAMAYADTDFTGVLTVDPATGVVRVTNALQPGIHFVTVIASDGVSAATASFTLTITDPTCSDGSMAPGTAVSAGDAPTELVVGDFNEDGHQDLVISSPANNILVVRLGDGSGGFVNAPDQNVGTHSIFMAVGDFNEDGHQDLVLLRYAVNQVAIRLGDGQGGFSGTTEFLSGTYATAVAVGDFNEDGHQDLAITGTENVNGSLVHLAYIRLGDGQGGFSGSTNVSVGALPYYIVIGDFNEDGHQDLATANSEGNSISVRLGDGLGGFGGGADIGVGQYPYGMTIGDFNGDGHQDLISANLNENDLSILLGDGTGGFNAAPDVPAGPTPNVLRTGDFNGDGQLDVAIFDVSGGNVSIRLGDGMGGFVAGQEINGLNLGALMIGDFNEDGRLDLAGSTASNTVGLLFGTDTTNPTIVCPANITVNEEPGLCAAMVAYTAPAGSDNCPGVTAVLTGGLGSGAAFPLGLTTETYTAIDAVGNTASCSFTVTVNDNQAPALSCPDMVVNSDPDQCSAQVTIPLPVIVDGCLLLQAEDFNAGVLPAGWQNNALGTNALADWNFGLAIGSDPPFNGTGTLDGTPMAYWDDDKWDTDGGEIMELISPAIDLSSYSVATLTFDYLFWNLNASFLRTEVWDGSAWQTILLVDDDSNNNVGLSGAFDVSAYLNSAFQVRFTYSDGGEWAWYGAIDNFELYGVSIVNDQTAVPAASGNYPVGVTPVTYTVTDVSGNVGSCTFNVTVLDSEAPTIVCPSDLTVDNDPGLCSAVVTYAVPVGADNCTGAVTNLTAGLGSGSAFPIGTTTEEYTVTDASGNTTSCSFFITVNDAEEVAIVCPSDLTVDNDPGQCSAVVTYAAPTVLDNCPNAETVLTAGLGSGSTFPVGTTTEAYTVTDAFGNTASCSFTITVNDNEGITLICPANITVNNDPGLCSAVVTFTPPVGTDNCLVVNTVKTGGLNSGAVFPLGTTTQTYTATASGGSTVTCSFTVTVNDNQAPTISCPANITVNNDPGQCGAEVTVPSPKILVPENCPVQAQNFNSGTLPAGWLNITLGSNQYARWLFGTQVIGDILINGIGSIDGTPMAYFVDDDFPFNGNEAMALYSPAINLTGYSSIFLTFDYVYWHLDNSSFRVEVWTGSIWQTILLVNSGVANNVLIHASFDVSAYLNTSFRVRFTYSDGNGGGLFAAIDNFKLFEAAITNNQTTGTDASGFYPVGATPVIYTVTDVAGNSNSCSLTVTVNDNQAPTLSCPSNITVNNDAGLCSAVVNYAAPTVTENCPGATILQTGGLGNGSTFPVGTTTETYLVTDAVGNSASCSFTVTVVDAETPVIVCPSDLTVDSDPGVCEALVNYTPPTGVDNCSAVSTAQTGGLGSGAIFPLGTTMETYTATSANGGTASCSFTVTVLDGGDPTIGCPSDIAVDNDPGGCEALVNYTPPTGVDNCSAVSTVQTAGLGSGSTFPSGVTTETYLATDAAGNTASCSFTVTVSNTNQGLILSCPADIVVNNDPGQCGAQVDISWNTIFSTTCLPLLQAEDFNAGALPAGWQNNALGANAQADWDFGVHPGTPPLNGTGSLDGTPMAYWDDDDWDGDGGEIMELISPAIDLSSQSVASLSFDYLYWHLGSSSFQVEVWDGSAWQTILFLNSGGPNDNKAVSEVIDVSAYLNSAFQVRFTYDDGDGWNWYAAIDNFRIYGMGIASDQAGAFFPIGATPVTYTVTDENGITASCSFSVTVIDAQDPLVFCPADVTVNNDPGQCSAVVNFGNPGGSDNCGGYIVLTGGLPNGSSFPVGTTANTFMAVDLSGNTATCTFHVTVNDTEPPAISCPADLTVGTDAGQCSAVVNYVAPTGTDNCSGPVTTLTGGQGSGSTFSLGTTTEEYTVTDAAGNTASCTFHITVTDTGNPTLVCPADITVNNDPDQCGAVVTYTAPVGTDNCSAANTVQTAGLGSGAVFPVGTTVETYSATDAVGNTASCSFQIIVVDNQAPTVICFGLFAETDPGECSAVVNYDLPMAEDNCSGVTTTLIAGLGSGSVFPVGVSVETIQAIDAAGNSTTCGILIEVLDAELPVLLCPEPLSVDNDPGQCGAIVNYDLPAFTDNCGAGIAVLVSGLPSGALFPIGVTDLTFAVTDAAGNSAFCNTSIMVIDSESPVITCSPDITVDNEPGQCSAVVSYALPAATDNCPIISLSQTAGLGSGAVFPIGTTTETVVATDLAGNATSCSFTVTVLDAEAPTISCPGDITVNNNPGSCDAVVSYPLPGGGDNCPVLSLSQTGGLGSGAVFPVGTTTETYTATDLAGNATSCSFTVTVLDADAPTIVCPADITVNNDVGQCSAVVSYVLPVGADNCPGALTELTAGLGGGSAFPIGLTMEEYTVTDASGNTAACSFTVTVLDAETLVLSCPVSILVDNDPGECTATVNFGVSASDNCPGVVITQTAGLPSGSDFPVGVTISSYTATDAAGNTVSCNVKIIVNDAEAPTISCPADMTVNNDPGTCGAVVSYPLPGGGDNCPVLSLAQTGGLGTGAVFPTGATTETYLATDGAGNTASCSFTVTVLDAEAPIVSCPADITVDNAVGQCSALVEYILSVSDNCMVAELVQTSGLVSADAFPLGTTTNSFTATDAAGNTASCSFTVTVMDAEGPTISCPADITVNNDPGQCGAAVIYVVSFDDNCPGETLMQTAGLGNGSFFPLGTTTNSFTATDASGNTASCSFMVTVMDAEGPTISCPSDLTVNNDPGQCSAAVNYLVTTFDNCAGSVLSQTAGVASGSSFPLGTTTNSFTATDASGNAASCSFTVTVNDAEAPTIACPSNLAVNADPGQCSAVVTFNVISSDNCAGNGTFVQTGGLWSGSAFPAGTTTNAFQVTDAAGNTAGCSFTVTVNDIEAPTIACPADISVNSQPGQCSAFVTYSVASSDNCADNLVFVQTSGLGSDSAFPLGTTTNTFQVTDAAGNTAGCSFTVTVNDGEAPTVLCQHLTVTLDDFGDASIVPADADAGSTDNCSTPALSLSQTAFGCADLPGVVVTLYATDLSGNVGACTFTVTVLDIDTDGDGVPNCADNCPFNPNANQQDSDGDGVGNACDLCPNADETIDTDGDGVPDCIDVCPNIPNPDQADADGDGVGDVCDNCVNDANSNQNDNDGDGVGNACDQCNGQDDTLDSDGDGVPDCLDVCPAIPNPDQVDSDGDGVGDVCDNCPNDANSNQKDSDGDGIGNKCDNCKNVYNPDQTDSDGDGKGDACDNNFTDNGLQNGDQGLQIPLDVTVELEQSLKAYPNPFREEIAIEFWLPQEDLIRLAVYDLSGKLVRELQSGYTFAGEQQVTWNGRGAGGQLIEPGVYVLRLQTSTGVLTKQLILVR